MDLLIAIPTLGMSSTSLPIRWIQKSTLFVWSRHSLHVAYNSKVLFHLCIFLTISACTHVTVSPFFLDSFLVICGRTPMPFFILHIFIFHPTTLILGARGKLNSFVLEREHALFTFHRAACWKMKV